MNKHLLIRSDEMSTTERVTVTLPVDLVRDIDRLEKD
jgi:hypothetical protein